MASWNPCHLVWPAALTGFLACLATASLEAEPPARQAPPVPQFLRLLQQAAELRPAQPDAPAGQNLVVFPWSIAPPSTQAVSFVRNMQDFSRKLDLVATRFDYDPPGALQYSMENAQIEAGLRLNGPLMWFLGPRSGDRTPVVYALPATDHRQLISRLQPQRRGGHHKIDFEGQPSVCAPFKGYSLIAHLDDSRWLTTCQRTNGGFDQAMGLLNRFLARQDIGYAMMEKGFLDGLPIRLPFSDRTFLIPPLLGQSAHSMLQWAGAEELGAGTELMPGVGVRASAAMTFPPESPFSRWQQSMKLDRETLLQKLPAGRPALVTASSSCDEWNQMLAELLKDWLVELDPDVEQPLAERIDFSPVLGVTLMLENVPEDTPDALPAAVHLQVRVADAEASAADFGQFLQAFVALPAVRRQGSRITVQRLRIALRDAWQITFVQDGVDDQPETTLAIGTFAALDDQTILFQGGNAWRLRSKIEQIEQRQLLVEAPRIAASLGLLAPGAQQVLLLDAYQSYRLIDRFAGLWTGEIPPIVGETLEPFADVPPLGLANRFEPRLVTAEVSAPDALLDPLVPLGAQWLPLLPLVMLAF